MSLLSDLVPLGTSGYSGASGYSGPSGTSGYSGEDGAAGDAGAEGTSGYSGSSGTSGYSGPSGTSGYSAYSGSSGTSGYSGSAGSTPTTIDITVTAGEALSARDCVYIAPVTGGGLTAGRAYKVDADAIRSSTQGFWCGFATAAIDAAATGTVRVAGVLTGFTLTAGAPQYISATAGAITETAPTNSRIVGIALDTTNLLINTRGANTSVVGAGSKGYTVKASAASEGKKITFATDTSSALTTVVPPQFRCCSVSEGVSKGFWLGGDVPNAEAYKLLFSSETYAAATTANLSAARVDSGGLSCDSTKGYVLGGVNGATRHVTTDKVTYSTDTTAAVGGANLSQGRGGLICVNNFGVKGYAAGGNSGAVVATADKVTYSSDSTAAATTANLSSVRSYGGAVSETTTKGYFAGGDTTGGGAIVGTADKVTFSTDTTAAVTTANLAVVRAYFNTNGDGASKGYFCGGYTNAWPTTAQTDKLTYSTDTTAAATTANVESNAWTSGMSDVAA